VCGIAGLFDTHDHARFDDALIRRMTDAVAHRGPDGSGIHNEPGLALGHRRLSIIDRSGGHQPMYTPDKGHVIVFNGEIYNFRELRAELEQAGARFATRSDTEVLLHGWRHWNTGMLDRLQGMFAFALWDVHAETLFLARDKFGKKPLHYAALPDGVLVFGSEIKSILCHPGVGRSIDFQATSDFFTYGYVPDPKTIFTAIRKLPPAHYILARRGRPTQTCRYWNLLNALETPDQAQATGDSLLGLLQTATGRRLISDVPLGALLSGGVDSSAVVAMMAGTARGRIDTFSIGFDNPAFDESRYARTVSDRYQTRHVMQIVDSNDFSVLPKLQEIFDEPFGDVSAIPTLAVCALARKSVTVALSGDGGDEALGGYRRYAFHRAQEQVRHFVSPAIRRRILAPLAAAYPHGSWLPRPLRARTTLRELSGNAADAYAGMVAALTPDIRTRLLTPAFRDAIQGYRSEDVVRDHFNVDAPLDPVQRAQYADVMTYLPGDILVKIDRASMANSLELRAPFLDPDFFARSFFLPLASKLDRYGGKACLKQALTPYLPHDVLYRTKQGFTVPLTRWFRNELRDQIQNLAHSQKLGDSGVVDMHMVGRMAAEHLRGGRDHSKALWLTWVFDSFLRHQPA
jgi:asparagine synthase (glutamine-hydrolysing)